MKNILILADARDAASDLAEIVRADSRADRRRWSEMMARVLQKVERITRLASIDEAHSRKDDAAEPLGLSAGPMLEMVALYLNERTGGTLLGDLEPGQLERLRAVLTQLALRVGFAAAGRTQPAGLLEEITRLMRDAEDPVAMIDPIRALLAQRLAKAPHAPPGEPLGGLVRRVLSWTPKALQALEALIRQWDRMERIELELLQGQTGRVLAATIKVRPGQEVRMADVMIFQPALVFRGTSRILVLPEAPVTKETVVLFDPGANGAVELRFEGFIYSLVRLLAMPLASGSLREVRVSATSAKDAPHVTNVAVFMEARDAKKDPRRLLLFQDTRMKKARRTAFSVKDVLDSAEQVFNYLTPGATITTVVWRRLRLPTPPKAGWQERRCPSLFPCVPSRLR